MPCPEVTITVTGRNSGIRSHLYPVFGEFQFTVPTLSLPPAISCPPRKSVVFSSLHLKEHAIHGYSLPVFAAYCYIKRHMVLSTDIIITPGICRSSNSQSFSHIVLFTTGVPSFRLVVLGAATISDRRS